MSDQATSPQKDFNRLYSDVSASISAAMAEVNSLAVEHKQGKQEIGNIMERLRGIQTRFDGELELLEEHAEWDKFTMAFFGETNAGKSTIIESLRILFKEEARQELLDRNTRDLARYEQAVIDHVNEVRDALGTIYVAFATDIARVRQDTAALNRALQEESSARVKRKLWLFAGCGAGSGAILATVLMLLMGK